MYLHVQTSHGISPFVLLRRLTGGAQAAVEAGVKKAQSVAAQAAAQAAAKEVEKQMSAGFGAIMGRRK